MVLITGLFMRSTTITIFAGIMFLALGMVLMSGEPIQKETVSVVSIEKIDSDNTTITVSYENADISNDDALNALHLIFFYGSFAVFLIAFGFVIDARNKKRDKAVA